MFGLGPMELVVIAAAALLLFGPKRLPEFAKNLGKGIRDFKKALDGSEENNAQLPNQGDAKPKADSKSHDSTQSGKH